MHMHCPPLISAVGKSLQKVVSSTAAQGVRCAIGLLKAVRPGRSIRFVGSYGDWSAAVASCEGYAAPVILQRVRDSAAKVRDGIVPYERDGVTFDRALSPFPLITCLLRIGLGAGGKLRVLDFGGSLGTTYYQCRDFLRELGEVAWCVVEQENFVRCGKAEFERGALRFEYSLELAMQGQPFDVILLSSVLPYHPDPYGLLQQVCECRLPWILIDRTPLLAEGDECITVQHTPAWVYGAPVRYPARFLCRDGLEEVLRRHYDKCLEFTALDPRARVGDRWAEYVGQLWQRRNIL